MSFNPLRPRSVSAAAGVATIAASLGLLAQAPAAPPTGAPPAVQTPSPTPAPAVPGGGRAGAGAQADDPFEGADLSPKDPIVAASPAEEQKRFALPPGYRIEPVLTEPDIEEPLGDCRRW